MLPDMYAPPSYNPADISIRRTWILDDGRAGHLNQSLGVAQALNIKNPQIFKLNPSRYHRLFRLITPQYAWHLNLREDCPPPEIIIATGWQNSIQARRLKRQYPEAFLIQMMSPSGTMTDYDVIAMPLHNSLQGDFSSTENIITTVGAPNRITETQLKQEAERWASRLQDAPKPRLAVLIGGPTRGFPFSETAMTQMMQHLITFANDRKYSLMVTTSRRTPSTTREILRTQLQTSKVPHYFWTGEDPLQRDNPYLAFLATAEAVIVTAESISMISEACTAGKPTYVWGIDKIRRKKFNTFYDVLLQQGRIAKLEEKLAVPQPKLNLRPPTYPLADTQMVAGFVQGQWAKRISAQVSA